MSSDGSTCVTLDVRKTIARIVQNHTDEAEEEAGYIADDIMQALRLTDQVAIDTTSTRHIARGQHIWPCSLFYVGNWDGDRPQANCTCSRQMDAALEVTP